LKFIRKLAGLGAALAVAALLFGALTSAAHAQQPPMTVYGTGIAAGSVVAASIGGVVCGTATADAQGQWIIQIDASAPCSPSNGDTITFTLNGQATTATETFNFGGAPANVAQGVTLTVVDATPTPPPPADTGNAGLVVGTAGGASSLLLALGLIAAAAMLAGGARVVTRK
jgi:hypothetical protein